MSIQVVSRACAICGEKLRQARGAEGCEACDLAFHVRCVQTAARASFRESAGLAPRREVSCPRCHTDVRRARLEKEQTERGEADLLVERGRRRYALARVVGAAAVVAVSVGLVYAILATGVWTVRGALFVVIFGVGLVAGVRTSPVAMAASSGLCSVALAGLAWTLIEGDAVASGVAAGAGALVVSANAWVLLGDRSVRAYVAHAARSAS